MNFKDKSTAHHTSPQELPDNLVNWIKNVSIWLRRWLSEIETVELLIRHRSQRRKQLNNDNNTKCTECSSRAHCDKRSASHQLVRCSEKFINSVGFILHIHRCHENNTSNQQGFAQRFGMFHLGLLILCELVASLVRLFYRWFFIYRKIHLMCSVLCLGNKKIDNR